MGVLADVLLMRQQEQADIAAIPDAINNFIQLRRQNELDELNRRNIESQIKSRETQSKFNILGNLGDTVDIAEKTGNLELRNKAKIQIDNLLTGKEVSPRGTSVDSFISPEENQKRTILNPTSKQIEKEDLIPVEFNIFGEPIKFKSKKTVQDEIRAKKLAETNFKREVFRQDLESFQEIDNQLKRGTGFFDRIQSGLKSKVAALDQSTATGFAVATHQAARKRLRVQLVRAAGDVGNINIVEQKAAEEMIPREFDSEGTAKLKNAFLNQLSKAINDNSENDVKRVLAEFMKTESFRGPKGEQAEKIIGKQNDDLIRMGFDPDKFEIIGEE